MEYQDIEGEKVEPPDDLDDYIDHVVAQGYALTIAERVLCFLRGGGLAIAAIVAGAVARLFWSFASLGWLAIIFALCLSIITGVLALGAITQFFAALFGSEAFATRRLRERLR